MFYFVVHSNSFSAFAHFPVLFSDEKHVNNTPVQILFLFQMPGILAKLFGLEHNIHKGIG